MGMALTTHFVYILCVDTVWFDLIFWPQPFGRPNCSWKLSYFIDGNILRWYPPHSFILNGEHTPTKAVVKSIQKQHFQFQVEVLQVDKLEQFKCLNDWIIIMRWRASMVVSKYSLKCDTSNNDESTLLCTLTHSALWGMDGQKCHREYSNTYSMILCGWVDVRVRCQGPLYRTICSNMYGSWKYV